MPSRVMFPFSSKVALRPTTAFWRSSCFMPLVPNGLLATNLSSLRRSMSTLTPSASASRGWIFWPFPRQLLVPRIRLG